MTSSFDILSTPDGVWEERTDAMPHDLAAEASVLGAMMMSEESCAIALSLLQGQDFYLPLHESLFRLMGNLFTAGQPVDGITVRASAIAHGLAEKIQNGVYLSRLVATPASPVNIDHYALIVRGKAVLRKVAETSLRGYHEAKKPTADPSITPSQILNDILKATTDHIDEDTVSAADAAEEAVRWVERRLSKEHNPILTGYPDLDSYLTEISPGQLVLVAARPSTGKSVVLLDIARHVSLQSLRPTLLFSLEMSAWEIGLRLIAASTGIPLGMIKEGRISDEQWSAIAKTMDALRSSPLTIETNPHLTVADIRARAIRHKRKNGLDLILVDYLGLITPGTARRDHYVEIGEIARGLKILAKDVAPVVAAAQLNRNSEHRPDKRPVLADLRDSGSLEQDSDVVLLLHREEMHDPTSPRVGEVDVIVAKNRNGASGTVTLSAQLDKARFCSLYSGI